MICTVTFNPSLDYIIRVNGFRTGTINRTTYERIFAGGKGINVSTVLRSLGHASTAYGFTAGFTGQEIRHRLETSGITARFIEAAEGLSRINVKMKSDEETEINGQGPHLSEENINELFRQLNELQKDDILVISGSIPSSLPDDMYERIMNLLAGRGIQRSRRFVREQDLGPVHDCPGYGNSLLLSAGQLGGHKIHAVTKPDLAEGFHGPIAPLLPRDVRIGKRQFHIGKGRLTGQELECLEHEPDFIEPKIAHLIVGQACYILPGDQDLPFCGHVKTADEIHQRRLAGSGRSHNGSIFSLSHLKIHIPKDRDLHLAGQIVFIYTSALYYICHTCVLRRFLLMIRLHTTRIYSASSAGPSVSASSI